MESVIAWKDDDSKGDFVDNFDTQMTLPSFYVHRVLPKQQKQNQTTEKETKAFKQRHHTES